MHRGHFSVIIPALVAFVLLFVRMAISDEPKTVSFNASVRPILADKCFACHGPDAAKREADLRLDDAAIATAIAIVPGDPDGSEMIARITSDDPDVVMPPPHTDKSITEEELQLLRDWISTGANYEKHWAFIAPVRPVVPEQDSAWPRGEIDQFVLRKLTAAGLSPSQEVSREKYIRRVSFDLTGLPPTTGEIDAFIQDESDEAYETLIDGLLASPHYGERMAIDWLDGARFADSNGYQNDFRRSMWPWRDWVIQAFNDNLPFDQFVVEQIAGDMLPNASLSQRLATGFNRNHRMVTEGGSIEDEWLVENVVDRVETTSMVFLGLTMGCCRCHDHKYDPISQREFYRFFAFFNNVDEKGVYIETRGNVPPLVQVTTAEQQTQLNQLDSQIASARVDFERAQRDLDETIAQFLRQDPTEASGTEASVQLPLDDSLQSHPTSEQARHPAEPQFRPGIFGQALHLDGTLPDHLDLGQNIVVDHDQPFSVSVWVRREADGAIYSKMDDEADYRGVDLLIIEDGRLKVHLIHKWRENALAVSTKDGLPEGIWTNVCVTYDGSQSAAGLQVYLGGVPQAFDIDIDQLSQTVRTDQPFRIGRRSTQRPFKGDLADFWYFNRVVSAEEVAQLIRSGEDRIRATVGSTQELAEEINGQLRGYVEFYGATEAADARRTLKRLENERAAFVADIPTSMVLAERAERRPTYRLQRGVYSAPDTSEELLPGIPAALPGWSEDMPQDRLGLAQWLVHPDNPLTARVFVNRMWMRLFGNGLVRSTDNFGLQGEAPSHPELLDWLAVDFRENGWNVKRLLKMLVLSATYRQDSAASPDRFQADPENRLLARGPRVRLPAELIRDNSLAVSGLLATTVGGPSVKPYQPAGLWEELAGGANEGPYVLEEGENLYRRSLYTNRKRTVPHTTMSTFDAPSFEICQIKRSRTNTPLQALALLNDVTYVEAARFLGMRMMEYGGNTPSGRLTFGFRLCTGRLPTTDELQRLQDGLDRHLRSYAANPAAAVELLQHGASASQPIPERFEPSELAAYSTMASVLLNLDETITKE